MTEKAEESSESLKNEVKSDFLSNDWRQMLAIVFDDFEKSKSSR